MYQACIAVVDATRARIFLYQREARPEGVCEDLLELVDLLNPARRLAGTELFADAPPSSRVGSRTFGIDDHREAHVRRLDTEFAKQIVEATVGVVKRSSARRLVLCAKPNMLGDLRSAAEPLRRERIELVELARDFVKLTSVQLRDQLASHGVLPRKPTRDAFA